MKTIEINNTHYQECDIIMLPTDKVSKIGLNIDKKIYLHHSELTKNLPYYQPQHIYILLNEEIKGGDWYITNDNKVLQCREVLFGLIYADGDYGRNNNSIKGKVIATTDSSLGYTDLRISPVHNFCDLQQIPQQIIEHFIDEYNESNVIKKVLVEVELYHGINTSIAEVNAISGDDSMNWKGVGDYRDYKIKFNQNNEANILSEQNNWLSIQQHGNTLEYWKNNAEEDYMKVPISVLKYITCLEETLKKNI
jgi:hypothetical protein